MNYIRIGKEADEHEKIGQNRLERIRRGLMAHGGEESEKDKPSSFAMASEMAISAIFEGIPDLVCDAFKVLENPPSTWDRYMAMHSGRQIYEMEFGELREAIKRELKAGKSELSVHKEMTHVLAAALYMELIDDE